ncbi:MAG: hypothetical protein ACI4SH_08290 [Candidatus Scatosoma sp.]
MKNVFKRIAVIISAALLCFFSAVESFFSVNVFADSADVQEQFEQINVLDDLKNTTIGENKFNLVDYNFDESKKLQIFSLVEFCYSFYADNQQDYGLYLYIYNPQGLKFEQDSLLHAVTMRHGNDTSKTFSKYRMQFLNCSQGDYFGLFYKFKIVLSDEQKTEILQGEYKVNSTERQYEIGEIELKRSSETNADSYQVGTIYKFSGYAKGYGSDESADSTLSMLTVGGQEVISLNVKPTFYRPDGTNGKNDYTQDSLHSVYFAVPNHFIEKYGEMYAVHATWLNAVLKPMLVTGNQDAYNAISTFLGDTLPEYTVNNLTTYYTDDLNYSYYGDLTSDGIGDSRSFSYGYGYNTVGTASGIGIMYQNKTGRLLDTLYGLFYSGSGLDSADHAVVSSEDIYEEIKKSKAFYGGDLVNGKFSKKIFESVDDKITDVNLSRDDLILGKSFLTSQKLTQSFWDKFWGKENYTTVNTDNISVIEEVTDEKMNGDYKSVCDRLYIFKNDFNDFKSYYNKYTKSENNEYKEKCTIYLFRYMVSDYIAQEATLCEYTSEGFAFGGSGWVERDTNARFFQETVNLDFDIIDLTFVKDDVYTVIPVAMSPIDVIHDSTGAVYTKSDKDNDWWKKIFEILLVIVLLVVLMPVLPTLISVLVKIILLPFKLISAVIKGISKAFHKKE